MKFNATPLAGLFLIETTTTRDERGQFTRLFCEKECAEIRPDLRFTQINMSATSQKGTIRGMHYQNPPAAESKLIRCLRGSVFDVAVDLRVGSPTFLQWHGLELSEDESNQFFIPEGFAHGFQALTDNVHLLYMHTAAWSRPHEAGLRYSDPALSIAWPLPVTQISEKDRHAPLVDGKFTGVRL